MDRYVCVHAHFYQPPRENAWLEAVELQDSAYPYHDWNERITAECYAPNATSRILNQDGRIASIVSNYSRISFNFGPTLLGWMAENSPATYEAILAADRESQARFSGHGSALAQAYNHMILPLANRRDKYTQLLWGIRDFEHRFGRQPEGMWLPETAVDVETLEVLAELGMKFTILAPHQAARVRPIGRRSWRNVSGGRIDPSMAYRTRLPSGRTINLFFYDGPISRAVAFEDLLANGERFAERILGGLSESRNWPQLMHIATDGETYGHHRAYADMALAYALHYIECGQRARLTNYGEYLAKHPPTREVQIIENTSWSCIHGIERWRADCGCNSGMHAGWHQQWRAPLRAALDWLRGTLAVHCEQAASAIFKDPWQVRNEYITVVLDRSRENVDQFMRLHTGNDPEEADVTRGLQLLELQRHLMLMYTSCGWFFDELSGIETVQVIHYAARAIQLAQVLFSASLEEPFLARLALARSNVPELGDGRNIYERFVRPAMVDLEKVGAHYAVSSPFEEYGDDAGIYCYTISRQDHRSLKRSGMHLALGRATIKSNLTWESLAITYGVLHLGDHQVSGGVRVFRGEPAYDALRQAIIDSFEQGDVAELIRCVDKNFGAGIYTLRLLFRDEQRKVLDRILRSTMDEAASLYHQFYDRHAHLIRFVTDAGIPLPKRFQMAVDFTINTDLLDALSAEVPSTERIIDLIEQVRRTGIALDVVTLEFAFRHTLERLACSFQELPVDLAALKRLQQAVELRSKLPFEVRIWEVQNRYFAVMQACCRQQREKATNGDAEASTWLMTFVALGEMLGIEVAC